MAASQPQHSLWHSGNVVTEPSSDFHARQEGNQAGIGRASAVLVNPALVGKMTSFRRMFERTLAQEGWSQPVWIETTRADDRGDAVRAAVQGGADVLFACGGDGTISTSLTALLDSRSALAVVPLGTGNVLALNLGVPLDVASAIRTATRGGRRRIDLGEVEGRIFAVATGIGLDAQMLAEAPSRAKSRLGWLAYAGAVLRHLDEPRFAARIRVDGGPWLLREARSILVANLGRLPGGISLLPTARADDGLLDVAVIAPGHLGEWAWLLASLIGRHPRGGRIETFQGRQVEIATDSPQAREVDGDLLLPGTALTVRVAPSALTVCVP